jgi:hypothetical protein
MHLTPFGHSTFNSESKGENGNRGIAAATSDARGVLATRRLPLRQRRGTLHGPAPRLAAEVAITVAVALPNLAVLTREAKSYAERMFIFPVVGSLNPTRPAPPWHCRATD